MIPAVCAVPVAKTHTAGCLTGTEKLQMADWNSPRAHATILGEIRQKLAKILNLGSRYMTPAVTMPAHDGIFGHKSPMHRC